MNIIRNIILSICILVCTGNSEAIAKGKLKVTCKKESLSPRINYATQQVRLACEEVSVNATIKVRIQDDVSPENFWAIPCRNVENIYKK